MIDEISKLKSKDAKLTAMAHVDSKIGSDSEMIEALKLTDKMSALKNASLKLYSETPGDKRPLLTALEFKIDMLESQFWLIAQEAESLGLDSDKFIKTRRDYIKLRVGLRDSVAQLTEKLGPDWSPTTHAPFLEGFLNK